MKEAIENSDYEAELDRKLKEHGYDKPPDIETLLLRAERKKKEHRKIRRRKQLKVAGFILAAFIAGGVINVFGNSNAALAGRFEMSNLMFNLRHGFVINDFQFNSTQMGRELIIEKEEQIPIARDFLRNLKVPRYIPEGYSFLSLHITNNPRNEYLAWYIYKSEDGNFLTIKQEKISPHNAIQQLSGVAKDFLIGEVRAFYVPCFITGNSSIFVNMHTDLIQVMGKVELDELIKIVEMLE